MPTFCGRDLIVPRATLEVAPLALASDEAASYELSASP